MNSAYNIEIPPYRETISFTDLLALPIFGAEIELLHVGHKALLVMESTTRDKMLEYSWENELAPIMETVKDEKGVVSFIFQMVPVVFGEE